MTRALRILLVANDGFSAGHVVRTLAIARALARGAARRGIELATVLATTSEADALLAGEALAVVRLPAPARARSAGLSDADRRRVVAAAIDATAGSFAPDLIVVDTFPNGPHGELAGIGRTCKRALVRRALPDDRVDLMTTGLGNYDRLILVDDAGFAGTTASIASVIVPPITLGGELLDRAAARNQLGLPDTGRAILIAAGGGGDQDAVTRAHQLATTIARLDPDATIVLATGPLDPEPRLSTGASQDRAADSRLLDRDAGAELDSSSIDLRITRAVPQPYLAANDPRSLDAFDPTVDRSDASHADRDPSAALGPSSIVTLDSSSPASHSRRFWILRVAPLQPYLAAFDVAFSPAGYNTAHELATATVPAVLFALPRPFDDQAARAVRLAVAGHAHVLPAFDDAAIAGALAWARSARPPGLATGGADRAADALYELVGA